MTLEETAKCVALMFEYYPYDKGDRKAKVHAWHYVLSDYDYSIVQAAIIAFASTDRREVATLPPVGTLVAKIQELTMPKTLTEFEAAELIKKACSNSIYHADQEFSKLPPVLQSMVGSSNRLKEWALMDSERFESVILSNFMRSYKVRVLNEREYQMLPDKIKHIAENLAGNMTFPNMLQENK